MQWSRDTPASPRTSWGMSLLILVPGRASTTVTHGPAMYLLVALQRMAIPVPMGQCRSLTASWVGCSLENEISGLTSDTSLQEFSSEQTRCTMEPSRPINGLFYSPGSLQRQSPISDWGADISVNVNLSGPSWLLWDCLKKIKIICHGIKKAELKQWNTFR